MEHLSFRGSERTRPQHRTTRAPGSRTPERRMARRQVSDFAENEDGCDREDRNGRPRCKACDPQAQQPGDEHARNDDTATVPTRALASATGGA